MARPGGGLGADPVPVPACVDLAMWVVRLDQVAHEPSCQADYGPCARGNDPRLKIISCRAGHICSWGGSILVALTNRAGPIARMLAALPGARLGQDGVVGVTVLFDMRAFTQVARLMHPRRRRWLNSIVEITHGPRRDEPASHFSEEAVPARSTTYAAHSGCRKADLP